jgi:hypothetical protein
VSSQRHIGRYGGKFGEVTKDMLVEKDPSKSVEEAGGEKHCQFPGCIRRGRRWYGFNANLGKPGKPNNVKARFCGPHARVLRRMTGNRVIALGFVRGRMKRRPSS